MLAAALRDGTAERRTTFELFARRLPAGAALRRGRRNRPVAGSVAAVQVRRRGVPVTGGNSSTPTRCVICAIFGSAAISTATPKASCISPGPPCCRCAAASPNAWCSKRWRCRSSTTTGDRVRGGPHGQRGRRTPADGDGIATNPRARGGRRGPRGLYRRLRRVVQPGGAAAIRNTHRGHRRARIHHAAHRRTAPEGGSWPHFAPRSTLWAWAPRCWWIPTT